MDNFPHNRHGMIDRACGCIGNFDNAIVAVEVDNFKYFSLEVAHLRHDDVDDILRGSDLLLWGEDFDFTETPPDFQRGLNLRYFGRAEAFKFFPLAPIGMAHVAEGAELINNPARQINGADALRACAQENCQKFGIAERPRAVFEKLFSGAIILRPAFDSGFFSLIGHYLMYPLNK